MKNIGLWADLGLVMVALIWGWGYTATEYAIASGLSSAMILLLRFAIAAAAMGARKRRSIVGSFGLEHPVWGTLCSLRSY